MSANLKRKYLLRTTVIIFLSAFMLYSCEYANTQEIKTKANAVPAVLSLTATGYQVQWDRAVSLPIRELSFLNLTSLPGQGSGRQLLESRE